MPAASRCRSRSTGELSWTALSAVRARSPANCRVRARSQRPAARSRRFGNRHRLDRRNGGCGQPRCRSAPSSHFMLTTVTGGMVAAGSAGPGKGHCTIDIENLALLRPGAEPDVIPLHTPPGVPAPGSITADADAVVVTNSRLAGITAEPPTRKCQIYDLTTGTWHRARTHGIRRAVSALTGRPMESFPSANSAPTASNRLASAAGCCDRPAMPDVMAATSRRRAMAR